MTPEEIRRRRLAYPLSIPEFADRLGVSQGSVRHWEHHRRTPRPAQQRALEAFFGLRGAEPEPTPLTTGASTPTAQGWDCLKADPPCGCRCHAISAGRKAGARSIPKTIWRSEEIAYLKGAIGRGDLPEEVAEYLTKNYSRYRSRRAVVHKAVQLGLSFRTGWYSEADVKRMLGVNSRRVRGWREAGYLTAQRHIGRIKGLPTSWWRIEAESLDTFVRRYAGTLINPTTIRDRALKSKAEIAAAVNRRAS